MTPKPYDLSRWIEKAYPFMGLQIDPRDHGSDNGLLFTATAQMLGLSVTIDPVLPPCLTKGWLLNRYPGDSSELESWDDYVGVAAVSAAFANIALHGGGFWSYWDNTETRGFKWAAWLGRFPGFVPFLKVAAGKSIGPAGVIELALSFLLVLSAKPTDTSGKCLDYLRLRTVAGKFWLVDQAIRVWWWKVRAQNGSMAGVYRVYFGDHPITWRAEELGI